MQPLTEAQAIAGHGLAGDRYLKGTGYYSRRPQPDGGRQLTLLETEELEKLESETGIRLDPSESRRNVLTRAISVNDLIGERFRIGGVLCEGIRICEPCTYLERLTGKRVMRPLVHRGGLRARIVSGGFLKVGDEIWHSPEEPAEEKGPKIPDVHSPNAENVGKVDPSEVQAEGTLKKRGDTPAGGGTHYLQSGDAETVSWTLESEELDLDDFLELEVRVLGYEVEDVPADSHGARLMNVFLVTSV